MLKSKKNNNDDNFLLYIPMINHSEWVEKEGKVCLVFKHDRKIEVLAAWLTKKPIVTDTKLDKMGSSVWKLIDNNRTIYEIGQLLLEEYGQDCKPVYKRLTMYLRYLNKKRWIKFKNPSLAKEID